MQSSLVKDILDLPAEEALLQSSQNLLTILNSVQDAIFLHDLDGQILDVNEQMLTLYRVERDEALHFSIMVDYSAADCPADRLPQLWSQVLAGENLSFPWTARRPHDGSTFAVEVFLRRITLGRRDVVLATVRDISQRLEHEERLRLAERVFENSIEGITITDCHGTIERVNPAFTEITGYQAAEVLGQTPRVLKSDRHGPRFYQDMWRDLLHKGCWQGEIWNRRKSGEAYPEWLSISAITDGHGRTTHYVAVFHDITELKRKDELVRHQAYHDALTGLPNHLLLRDRLSVALSRAQREAQGLAVIFLDLDHFKKINDGFGHVVGDIFLQQIAERLAQMVRKEDTLARLGGDEFLLVVQNIRNAENAAMVVHKIMHSLAQVFRIQGQEVYAGASIGISLFPHDGTDPETLIRNAEIAMYRAKETGRSNYQLFTADMNEQVLRRLTLENNLRKALQEGQFQLYYQPKIDLRSGTVTGMEALVRWLQADGTVVPPDEFIPVAEETGLIGPLGDWILRAACLQTRQWREAGHPLLRVAVNLSARQFQQTDLACKVLSTLQETGLPPEALELEITESALMTDMLAAKATLEELTACGITIALDDFGTGYSSLYYLKRLPIATVKIDRSFIADLPNNADDIAIIKAILSMSADLNLRVVAEGVEGVAQLNFLRRHGCTELQGYFFSPPLPPREFGRWLEAFPVRGVAD